jgi:hypothetical protein
LCEKSELTDTDSKRCAHCVEEKARKKAMRKAGERAGGRTKALLQKIEQDVMCSVRSQPRPHLLL